MLPPDSRLEEIQESKISLLITHFIWHPIPKKYYPVDCGSGRLVTDTSLSAGGTTTDTTISCNHPFIILCETRPLGRGGGNLPVQCPVALSTVQSPVSNIQRIPTGAPRGKRGLNKRSSAFQGY